jgi:hypothetical protein
VPMCACCIRCASAWAIASTSRARGVNRSIIAAED